MRGMGMKSMVVLATIAVLLGGVRPVLAYDQDRTGESREYVLRSEYEHLKKIFEQQHEDYEQLKKDVAKLKEAQQETATGQALAQAEKSEAKPKVSQSTEILPPSEITPGWERARAAGWMTPSRLNTKSVRIAKMTDMNLYMGLDTVGRFQALTQDNVADTVGTDSIPSRRLRPGF